MAKEKSPEQMTLAELTAHSAKLHDQLYALKAEIQATQQWRNRRALEADAERNIAEAKAQLNEAKAITAPPHTIQAESIKSDEEFGKLGESVKKFATKIVKIISVR